MDAQKYNGLIPKVEKGIPIPDRYAIFRSKWKFIGSMKPGESFIVPEHNVKAAVWMFAKRIGVKLTTRKVDEGYRIWRVE